MIRTLSTLVVTATLVQFALVASNPGSIDTAKTFSANGAGSRPLTATVLTEFVLHGTLLADARLQLQKATTVLTSSAGRVQDDDVLVALQRDIEAAATTLTALSRTHPEGSNRWTAFESTPSRTSTATFLLVSVGLLDEELSTVSHDASVVNEAVAQRTAAAAAAAARASAPVYSERVWASGFQTQLDACRGAVNLTAVYGVAVIGEKWQCGGSRFPQTGALVRLTGTMSGLYRVGPVVAVLDAYTQTVAEIPRGQGLLYQTCRGGSAHTETFTQLIPESR